LGVKNVFLKTTEFNVLQALLFDVEFSKSHFPSAFSTAFNHLISFVLDYSFEIVQIWKWM